MKNEAWDNYSNDQKKEWMDNLCEGLDSQQSSFARLLHRPQEKNESLRKNRPHVAIVEFKITTNEIDTDGNLISRINNANDLKKIGMNDSGRLIVKGGNFSEVAKKVDSILRLINEQN